MKFEQTYFIDVMKRLIETPSPTGYYVKMKPVIEELAGKLGYSVSYDNRDTAYVTVEGEDTSRTVCVSAHADTLGAMVRGINADGTLRFRCLGGVNFPNLEGENVTVLTRSGEVYTGMIFCAHHSTHSFADARTMERDEDTLFVLLDEHVSSAEQTRALGIRHGDYINIEPRFTFTKTGYIKTRYIDNKGAMALSFMMLKNLAESGRKPACNTVFSFSFYEEIGLGGVRIPAEISEYVAVDIAILGPDSDGSEEKVTICAKDATMVYDWDLTNRLISLAEQSGCDYAVDVFFRYGSDAGQAVRSGNNLHAAAFGMAVYCSHGVERTHIKGLENAYRLMEAYVMEGAGRD